MGLGTVCAFHVEQHCIHSSELLLPYPGGKSSMAAFVQVVLMVRTGNCGCRLFHRYDEATSAADPSATVDISETGDRREKLKHHGFILHV